MFPSAWLLTHLDSFAHSCYLLYFYGTDVATSGGQRLGYGAGFFNVGETSAPQDWPRIRDSLCHGRAPCGRIVNAPKIHSLALHATPKFDKAGSRGSQCYRTHCSISKETVWNSLSLVGFSRSLSWDKDMRWSSVYKEMIPEALLGERDHEIGKDERSIQDAG